MRSNVPYRIGSQKVNYSGKIYNPTSYFLKCFGVVFLVSFVILIFFESFWSSVLVSLNITAFIALGYDKYMSLRNKFRVPEKVLLIIAAAYGSIGGIAGMYLFNHKTSKEGFQIRLWTILGVQTVIMVFIII